MRRAILISFLCGGFLLVAPAASGQEEEAIVPWLKKNGIRVKTVEAGNGFDDLQPLKPIFKDLRFVGLGEATHGTREFFQFKHRMLEFLVEELGFRVFAIEASYSACENINDYVMGRSDDGAKALDSQVFWVWNTNEVREMIDWMRTYNARATAEQKVKFVGFDVPYNQTGQSRLVEYLKRVAPERVGPAEELFAEDIDELKQLSTGSSNNKELRKRAKELQLKYNDLFAFLELRASSLIAKSNQAEYERMREYARVLAQFVDVYGVGGDDGRILRDMYMADNFRRLVEREPSGTRFVLWAHNAHIRTGDRNGIHPTMGSHLRRLYGKEYYALGLSFNQGSFQAREALPKDPANRMLRMCTVSPAPTGSIDWYLARTGMDKFIMDFRSAPRSAEIDKWLAAPHSMRSIGAVYGFTAFLASFPQVVIEKDYDGLFFIDVTTRARPNPSVKNIAPGP